MVAATGSGRERASMRIAGQQKGDSECVDFIHRGGTLCGLYTQGEEHCVGFIDKDRALCGQYKHRIGHWGTMWTL